MITKDKWVWMPHAGHFVGGNHCRFRLNTRVGKYIISTVGELWWDDRQVREIHARIHDPQWHIENNDLMGDYYSSAYFKRFGFEELGYGRTYETMVFAAVADKTNSCCPWRADIGTFFEMDGYKTSDDAYKGHFRLCNKYAKQK
jgi:hypothetical protein